MRRVVLISGAIVVAAVLAIVAGSGVSSSSYQVAAVFDSARGISPGPDFVMCDPGTSTSADLARNARVPVVPVSHTTTPIDIDDFFQIWSTPTRDRLRLLLDELGIGFAAQGQDLNALLQRASPTLQAVNRLLGIIDAQRAAIRAGITSSDEVTAQLAAYRAALGATLRQGARTYDETASVAPEITAGLRLLPPSLATTRASAAQLIKLSQAAVPVLDDLRASAPATVRALEAAPGFAKLAVPATTSLGPAFASVRTVLRNARPFAKRLQRFALLADPTGRLLDQLLVNLRDTGSIEGLLYNSYYEASLTSRFDALGHVKSELLISNGCGYSDTPTAGCDARWVQTGDASSTAPARRSRRARHHSRRRRMAPAASPGATTGAAPTSAGASGVKLPPAKLPPVTVPTITLPSLGVPHVGLGNGSHGGATADSIARLLHYLLAP
jgi:ABC-type transporter Mla subunit MlaD